MIHNTRRVLILSILLLSGVLSVESKRRKLQSVSKSSSKSTYSRDFDVSTDAQNGFDLALKGKGKSKGGLGYNLYSDLGIVGGKSSKGKGKSGGFLIVAPPPTAPSNGLGKHPPIAFN